MPQVKKPSLRAGLRKAAGADTEEKAGKKAQPSSGSANTEARRKLRTGHRQAIGIDDIAEAKAKAEKERLHASHIVPRENPLADRYDLLRNMPRKTIRKAWFTLAHLLLQPGATIVDMGCQSGDMLYAMAVLAPQFRFIGIDMDKQLIQSAKQSYNNLENLEYMAGDVGSPDLLPQESVDAVINSFILHEIYSGASYSDRSVIQTLENQFKLLKPEGIMLIRDFAIPMAAEYVLMEMPDVPSTGNDIERLSEADLLVAYSEQARPRQDPGCTGFFLEELPARFPKTRLFRLPSKWAYEFIMRKDERHLWAEELPKEYAFFNENEYRKTLRNLGSRVLYTAPHWDDQYVKASFDGRFRLYDESGNLLGTPPTSFIAIAQKIAERTSLQLNERRSANNPQQTMLQINGMRNELDGRIIDVISRDVSTIEILPYRLTEMGELNVFVHIGAPRGIANAIPRQSRDLDGRRWSGHMTEAIAVNSALVTVINDGDARATQNFVQDVIGLTPVPNRSLEPGPSYYPAPDFIDERIETRFIEVQEHKGPIEPRALPSDLVGFQAKGRIIELPAQSILNAISVGTIPNAQLELQIQALFRKLGMKAEAWVDSPLALPEVDMPKKDMKQLLAALAADDTRYKKARGPAGQWRMLQSVFVEECHENGGITGLASRNLDFVVSDENSENIAVVLPLVKNLSGEVMAGYVTDYLPVPQRHKGNGLTVSAPTLALPRDITTMEAARYYIAEHFKVKMENVTKLGESYFCHVGVTPQRVYPFAMTEPVANGGGPVGRGDYAPMDNLWMLNWWDCTKSFAKIMSLAYKCLGSESDMSPTWDFSKKFSEAHDRSVTTYSTDMRGLSGAPATSAAPSPPPVVKDNGDKEDSASPSDTAERKPRLK
jgi:ubiquinone/menaquinone biosynthesis C-methylase UbiE